MVNLLDSTNGQSIFAFLLIIVICAVLIRTRNPLYIMLGSSLGVMVYRLSKLILPSLTAELATLLLIFIGCALFWRNSSKWTDNFATQECDSSLLSGDGDES